MRRSASSATNPPRHARAPRRCLRRRPDPARRRLRRRRRRAPSCSPARARSCAGADVSGSAPRSTWLWNVEDTAACTRSPGDFRCPPVIVRVPASRSTAARPDRLRGHLHRRGCGVRVLRGAAGDHPRRDLADGAGEDRPGRGPAILPHGRAFRRPDCAANRTGRRGRRRPGQGGGQRRRFDPRRRADRRPRGETARARAGRGGGPAGAGSRAAGERRRPGRAAGVSRLPRRRARLPGVASRPR